MEKAIVKKDKFKWSILLALGIVIFGIFTPLLSNDFINYDDTIYVTGNQQVLEGLTYQGVIWAFTTFHAYNWHPLSWISHMVDIQLFGFNPHGHHLTSVLFHIANSLLLFMVFNRMTGTIWRSLCVALLFAVHPLHVESVAWIAERKDLLSCFFGFLSVLAYINYTRNFKIIHYLQVVLFFVLSLMSKPMLVTLPFILLLLDYWPLRRLDIIHSGSAANTIKSARRTIAALVREKVPLFVLTMTSSAMTYLVQRTEGAINVDTPLRLNIGNACISYVKYIFKMFWPHPLTVIYPFNPDEINLWNVMGAGALLFIVTYLLIRQIKRRPYLTVGWLWYVGTLVPVIGLIRIGDQAIADRYTYLPLVGLFFIIVWGGHELSESLRLRKGIPIALTSGVFVILTVITLRQEKYWRNSFVLFEHAISVTGDNPSAHKMLGLAYGSVMDVEKAASEAHIFKVLQFQYLVKVRPNDFQARYMLGNAYRELHRYDEAISEYLMAVKLNDKNSKAYNNLGVAYYSRGDIKDAIKAFQAAIHIDSKNEEAIYNLSMMETLDANQRPQLAK